MREQPPKNGLARRLWDLTDDEIAELFDGDRSKDGGR